MKAIKSFLVLVFWLALAIVAVFGKVEGAANVLAFGAAVFALLFPFFLSEKSIADAKPEDGRRLLPAWVARPLQLALVGTLAWGGLTWTAVGFAVAFACGSIYRQQVAKRDAGKVAAA